MTPTKRLLRLVDRLAVSPLTNRSVLVTGGTGSFGRAFVRRALDAGASRVVVISRKESVQAEMAASFADPRLRFMIGHVEDEARMRRAMRGIDLVVHAAALKRVDTCETNPSEAVDTNVRGTQAVLSAAIDSGVHRGVFLSTDKAATPNTLYGSTKLTAERLWTQGNVYAAGTRSRFVATRYGNVLGSTGSVVPLFNRQKAGGVLTLTDPGMTRFWMTIADAVDLVELALSEGRGGEVFIPKIPSASVLTIAKAIAPKARHEVVGIRPREKLHEMLIAEDESVTTFDHGDHYRIEPYRTWEHLPELDAKPVEPRWSYRSETNPDVLTVERLRKAL